MKKFYANGSQNVIYKIEQDKNIIRVQIDKYANLKGLAIQQQPFNAEVVNLIAKDNEEVQEAVFTKHLENFQYDLKQILI